MSIRYVLWGPGGPLALPRAGGLGGGAPRDKNAGDNSSYGLRLTAYQYRQILPASPKRRP